MELPAPAGALKSHKLTYRSTAHSASKAAAAAASELPAQCQLLVLAYAVPSLLPLSSARLLSKATDAALGQHSRALWQQQSQQGDCDTNWARENIYRHHRDKAFAGGCLSEANVVSVAQHQRQHHALQASCAVLSGWMLAVGYPSTVQLFDLEPPLGPGPRSEERSSVSVGGAQVVPPSATSLKRSHAWKFNMRGGDVPLALALDRGKVLVATANLELLHFQVDTGKLQARTPLPGPISVKGGLAILDPYVVVMSGGQVYARDVYARNSLWQGLLSPEHDGTALTFAVARRHGDVLFALAAAPSKRSAAAATASSSALQLLAVHVDERVNDGGGADGKTAVVHEDEEQHRTLRHTLSAPPGFRPVLCINEAGRDPLALIVGVTNDGLTVMAYALRGLYVHAGGRPQLQLVFSVKQASVRLPLCPRGLPPPLRAQRRTMPHDLLGQQRSASQQHCSVQQQQRQQRSEPEQQCSVRQQRQQRSVHERQLRSVMQRQRRRSARWRCHLCRSDS
eukprot:TRINITY_DN1508_c0_g1_i5.p1 TRINITY_DN1508_c0_g1~~TRINITY_DN1508_c0_g1_i5.p1  ORF type:complete len:510 (-),score=86.71 TRINITY_DN1508_c0_g1_i5:662-2191(-)